MSRRLNNTLRWLALAALGWLAGCAVVSDRVVLLPQTDGKPSAVVVRAGQQELKLDKPYAVAERAGDGLRPAVTTAAEVEQRYGAVLAVQPKRPQTFVLQFGGSGSELTAEAQGVLQMVREAVAKTPGADLVVTGHTDRVGAVEANDRLSLQRAQTVRGLLVAGGVASDSITVVGRGEREPAVATADEVAEPRNRRVEIKLR